ncbi:MAG: ArsR family transcriptional regulator [Caulobacterales bacterium 32-67-6]|nr:MAG: ArsR family transcriptional regulator [Caulobacterales bacterium 32-67-6]
MALSNSQVVDVLRAAGEPTRLRILALLAHEELAVLEICRVLDQSQPRVSRHLKLLAEAGLVERFPDGAWVFYRLVTGGDARRLVDEVLDLIEPGDSVLARDAERLRSVQAERETEAGAYFARNAARWDEIRALYVADEAVEAAIRAAAGPGPFRRLVDLGSGTGRMLTLLGPQAEQALGLDLSQQMLNIARSHVSKAGLEHCELRHGDIFGTRLPGESADLVVVHRLLIIDFAPHGLEHLRDEHQHRRLGFSDAEMERWLHDAGLGQVKVSALPPTRAAGLTIKIWSAERAPIAKRTAA